jgi:hypothetical protein
LSKPRRNWRIEAATFERYLCDSIDSDAAMIDHRTTREMIQGHSHAWTIRVNKGREGKKKKKKREKGKENGSSPPALIISLLPRVRKAATFHQTFHISLTEAHFRPSSPSRLRVF